MPQNKASELNQLALYFKTGKTINVSSDETFIQLHESIESKPERITIGELLETPLDENQIFEIKSQQSLTNSDDNAFN